MLDMNFVRENPDAVKEALAKRHSKIDLDAFLELDKQRRRIYPKVRRHKYAELPCVLLFQHLWFYDLQPYNHVHTSL